MDDFIGTFDQLLAMILSQDYAWYASIMAESLQHSALVAFLVALVLRMLPY